MDINFLETWNDLDNLYTEAVKNTSFVYPAPAPDLSSARNIVTDVMDIRGELETNTCIMYSPKPGIEPVLTRVQVRTLILRKTNTEVKVLCRPGRINIHLPGGGFDLLKDKTFVDTAKREAKEEFNIELKNVVDTKLYSWSYREDAFVNKHVADPEDRWYGYLTVLVVATYTGEGDNDNPEEFNRSWKWKPISVLDSNTYFKTGLDKYLATQSLDEAIYPKYDAREDIGEISYMFENLETLDKILTTLQIKKTYALEALFGSFNKDKQSEILVNTIDAGPQRRGRPSGPTDIKNKKEYSLSFSTAVGKHAERKPYKWGFGICLDGKELSRYYKFYSFAHAMAILPSLEITRIIALDDDSLIWGHKYFVLLGNWGYYSIDKYWFDILKNKIFLSQKNESKCSYYDITGSHVQINGSDIWKYLPFRFKDKRTEEEFDKKLGLSKYTRQTLDSLEDYRRHDELAWAKGRSLTGVNETDAFAKLQPVNIEAMYSLQVTERSLGIEATADNLGSDLLIDFGNYLNQNSRFNEHELRIWIQDPNIEFVQLPKAALKYIILPQAFKPAYNSTNPKPAVLSHIKSRVRELKLDVKYHEMFDASYDDMLSDDNPYITDNSDIETYNNEIDKYSKIISKILLNKEDAEKVFKELDPKLFNWYNSSSRKNTMNLLSIAIGKLAYNVIVKNIDLYMLNSDESDYNTYFNTARKKAKEEYSDILKQFITTGKQGRPQGYALLTKSLNYFDKTFNYYAPERGEYADDNSLPEYDYDFDDLGDDELYNFDVDNKVDNEE